MKAGYEIHTGVFEADEIVQILGWIPELETAAGTRNLLEWEECGILASDPRLKDLVRSAIGEAEARRAILFDKSPTANWNLGWHRDRKIAVQERIEVPGYTAWSTKEGVIHCEPPRSVLEKCLAVRIHLDDCGPENGPLRVIPGSHLAQGSDFDPSWQNQEVSLTANIGDVILMSPLTWHASSKATEPRHRRVVHIEYSSAELAGGLRWAF